MTTIIKHPDPAGPRLFPDTMGGFPPCQRCFQHKRYMAATSDRRISPTGALIYVCRGCSVALSAGRPALLPTGDALTETWKQLAHWSVNEEIEHQLVDRALAVLAPGLDRKVADEAFGELGDAMLWLQEVLAPGYDMQLHEPEMRDIDRLTNSAEERVADAVTVLIGGAP